MISAAELANKKFTGIDLPEPYLTVLGKLPKNFSMAIWGPAGSGKSTVAVDLAKVLVDSLGKGIYCSSEEGAGPSMQSKIKRLKADHKDLFVMDFDGMEDLKSAIKYSGAKFCIFDSASMSHIKVSDMESIHDFCKDNGVAFLYILHATKAGDFKGNSYLIHMPDTVLKVQDGIAKTEKNRFAETPQEFDVRFEAEDRENPLDEESENIISGIKAMKEVIEAQKDVDKAMKHPELGWISFVWGRKGNPKKGFAGGYGVSHIIAKRDDEGITDPIFEGQKGVDVALRLPIVIAKGAIALKQEGGRKLAIDYAGYRVIVKAKMDGKKKQWMLTGFRKSDQRKNPDETAQFFSLERIYAPEAYKFTRQPMGAGFPEDTKISQNRENPRKGRSNEKIDLSGNEVIAKYELKTGEGYFVIAQNENWSTDKKNQDRFKMFETTKSGAITEDWGTHPTFPGAKIFAVNKKIIEREELFIGGERLNPVEAEFSGLEYIENPADVEDELRENKAVTPDDIYEMITNNIISVIEDEGELPWQKQYESSIYDHGIATNFVSKKAYSGINWVLLNFFKWVKIDGEKQLVEGSFSNPYFLTFNQIEKLGGKLKKGAVGQLAVYYTKLYSYNQADPDLEFSTYKRDEMIEWIENNRSIISLLQSFSAEEITDQSYYPILKYYNIFNGEDIEGIEFGKEIDTSKLSDPDKIKVAEAIYSHYPEAPKVVHEEQKPFYKPENDTINMPVFGSYNEPQYYYSTLFHEAVHSTGHKKRLDRDSLHNYSKDNNRPFEELIAEMGAAYLSGEAGILFKTLHQSAAYLQGWNSALVDILENDHKYFFRAAARAQDAADHILDRDENGVPAYRNHLNLESAETESETEKDIEIISDKNGITVLANSEENRVQILFDSKPSEEIRDLLKANNFRWAPSKKAWQRKLTENARIAAEAMLPDLHNQDGNSKSEGQSQKDDSLTQAEREVYNQLLPFYQKKALSDQGFKALKEALKNVTGQYQDIPNLYEQDGKGKDATIYLHAFNGASDWYITELDKETKEAFGFTVLDQDWPNAELGYMSLDELFGQEVYKPGKSPELDLYWDTKTINEVIGDRKAVEAANELSKGGYQIDIYFKTDKPVTGRYDIIEAKNLIPSHNKDCSQNSKHLISKAQPRDRSGEDLCNQSKLMAQKLNPDLITVGNKAFDGAPVTLSDGQVIQGNGRSIALKIAYDEFEKQADKYRNYLLKNATKFGLTREYVDGFSQPVLVRKVDVSESEAVKLGNIVDTSQAKMNRLDQAKAYIRQLDEQKRQIIGRIINSSSGETLGEIIDDKGLMILDQLKDLDRTGLVQNNALTSDGKDFLKQLFAGLVFDSDKNKDALKHFAKLLHNTKAGIERSYGFIIPFIGTERDIAPTLQKSIEIVQAIQNNEAIDTIPDFLAQGDAFTGINRDRFSEKEVQLAEFLLPQSTQKAIKEAFQVYYFKSIGRNDLLNPVEKVSPDQAFQEAFVEQVRINPPEELVKLYTPAEFKKGDVVRDYYDNVKYEMTSKRKGTYYFKNLKTGKREKFRKSDKRFLRNRDVTPTLSLFRENPGTLAYMGITERVTIEDGNAGKELQGEFPTFLSGDKLYIIPKNRVMKVKNQVDDPEAVEAFEEFNNYNASDVDYKIDFPEEKAVAVGSAEKIWYASDKVIQPGDKKGKVNHYVHEFDPGKRPAVVKGDVLVIGNIEWDARGLLN